MSEIPKEIVALAMLALMVPESDLVESVARAILAERKRCADWCEKTAFIGYAKDRILSGEQP